MFKPYIPDEQVDAALDAADAIIGSAAEVLKIWQDVHRAGMTLGDVEHDGAGHQDDEADGGERPCGFVPSNPGAREPRQSKGCGEPEPSQWPAQKWDPLPDEVDALVVGDLVVVPEEKRLDADPSHPSERGCEDFTARLSPPEP